MGTCFHLFLNDISCNLKIKLTIKIICTSHDDLYRWLDAVKGCVTEVLNEIDTGQRAHLMTRKNFLNRENNKKLDRFCHCKNAHGQKVTNGLLEFTIDHMETLHLIFIVNKCYLFLRVFIDVWNQLK
jgi:hypothetical protein